MLSRRVLAGGIGISATVIGLFLLIVPAAASGMTTDEVVIVLLGLVAIGQSVLVASRRGSEQHLSLPKPEFREGTRTPGEVFDSHLNQSEPTIRNKLTSTAEVCLERFGPDSSESPKQRLRNGDWTDNELGAAFFSPYINPKTHLDMVRPGRDESAVRQAQAAIMALATFIDEHVPGNRPINVSRSAGDDWLHTPEEENLKVSTTDIAESLNNRTRHWNGIGVLTLVTIAVALLIQRPALLAVGTIGVALTAYGAFARARTIDDDIKLHVERSLETREPARGDDVRVHVTVRNEGERTYPDLRFIDGVPNNLIVTEGAARHATPLRPGQTVKFSYTIGSEYGVHRFEPMMVLSYDLTGETCSTYTVAGDAETLYCHPPPEIADEVELRDVTTNYAGRIQSPDGGSGIQFHDTRKYQPGDPISLIHWKSLARTGELTSITFQEERMAEVLVAVDARFEASLASRPEERSAIQRSVEAADILTTTFLEANNNVGITALSAKQCWLAPSRGNEHRLKARQLLAKHPAMDSPESTSSYVVTKEAFRIGRLTSPDTQVFLLSPLCDDMILEFLDRLGAMGIETTVLSPDPTTTTTPGETLARIERYTRMSLLREKNVPVFDWKSDEPLTLSLRRQQRAKG